MRSVNGRVKIVLFVLIILPLCFFSCKSPGKKQSKERDTVMSGTIHISADESFKPVIDAQIEVYEGLYPDAHIIPHYKPEADCLKDFGVDSIRMVIATRAYTRSEELFMADSLKVATTWLPVARDAIAVIVNPASPDSFFTMNEIREILTGRFNRKLTPVFDGIKATSTVRFIVDSVLHGDNLTPGAVAALTSEGVIDYVAKTPNAVGFIGVSWIGNKEDTMHKNFLKKVKIAYLESTDKPGGYVLPYQENIYMEHYPMVRDLVYTLKENYKGLGSGFADLLGGEKGQLVFRRAYLVPLQRNFTLRKVRLTE